MIQATEFDWGLIILYRRLPSLDGSGVPARTGAELITAFKHIMAGAPALKLPMLIMHGAADGISDPAGSRQLYELAQSKDKLLKLYAGLKHEIMNEPDQAQVLADICDWLDAHSA